MPTLSPARTPFGGRESHQAREIAESFGSDADRYDRARPRYPDELVDRIVAGAAPGQHRPDVPDILDVGCGTGIVARQFQAAGCRVLGVDPDARMADLARRHGLEVEVSRFEAWPRRDCKKCRVTHSPDSGRRRFHSTRSPHDMSE